ncbi:hypothetical protein [Natrialba sp. SSL1]|uniref:hypothetical protein n=1 Tax=Natrialba sp. SSL1 TaxID=1869245 RepID=UPI00209B0964|nr:hypothetical protein [Natrialba sp. SSL1]
MEQQWGEFATDIRSGDPEQVNKVVDNIEELDLEEQIELCKICFGELTAIYADSED